MDVNDYLDEEPLVRRTAPRRATVAQQPPQQPVRQQANHHEYVSREIVHDRRRVNDVARQTRAEFEDDEFLIDDQPRAPAVKQKRGLFGLGKPKTKPQDTRPLLHPTQPKRDIFQVVSMFALAVGVIGLSAWQAWTVTSINAGALSIKWVHVSQAAIALQMLILFFVVDLRKQ